MPKKSNPKPLDTDSPMRPATTPEARENQMIALAVDLAEQRLRDGTATSQEVLFYLKLATQREKREVEMMEKRMELMEAKIESIHSAEKLETLYKDAMEAMKEYRSDE